MRLSELIERLQEILDNNYDCLVSLSFKDLEPEKFKVNQEGKIFLDVDGLTFDDLISLIEDNLDEEVSSEFKKITKIINLLEKRGHW
jgi:hypothetical protein